MNIYTYHPQTHELLSIAQADPSPLEPDVWLIPAFATDLQPPAASERQVQVFNASSKAWALVPDWRAVALYSKATGLRVNAQLGDTPLVLNATEQPRPSELHDWDAASEAWLTSPAKVQAAFAQAKDVRIKAFRAEREIVLNRLIGIGFAAMQAGDADVISGCLTARQGLLDLTKHASITGATTEAQLKAAFKAVYNNIILSVPESVRTAFVLVES